MLLFYKKRGCADIMAVGPDIKSRNGARQKAKGDRWTCGCTTVYCSAEINAECLKCGGIFSRGQVHGTLISTVLPVKNENVIELVQDNANAVEESSAGQCGRCGGQGWIKAFTQEWDMIKCHHAPCPGCHSREWSEWSANRRLLVVK
jgi:hypothetical protein